MYLYTYISAGLSDMEFRIQLVRKYYLVNETQHYCQLLIPIPLKHA